MEAAEIKSKIDSYTKLYESEGMELKKLQKQLEDTKANMIRIEGAVFALREFLPKEDKKEEPVKIETEVNDSEQS